MPFVFVYIFLFLHCMQIVWRFVIIHSDDVQCIHMRFCGHVCALEIHWYACVCVGRIFHANVSFNQVNIQTLPYALACNFRERTEFQNLFNFFPNNMNCESYCSALFESKFVSELPLALWSRFYCYWTMFSFSRTEFHVNSHNKFWVHWNSSKIHTQLYHRSN